MSGLLATALVLAFTLVICLLAVQALLSPWLRGRRPAASARPSRPALAKDADSLKPQVDSAVEVNV